MNATEKQDLTTGPVAAHLSRQGTPFALGLVAIFSFEAVDQFFISKLGDAPLAAVSFFSDVNNAMRIAREEIFGPVMSVLSFTTAEEAIRIANDSIYGLAGAVWSNNINTAHKVAEAVRVGTMGINNYFGGDITVPFGGFKQSGNGRDKSILAFHDYTELKTTWIELI